MQAASSIILRGACTYIEEIALTILSYKVVDKNGQIESRPVHLEDGEQISRDLSGMSCNENQAAVYEDQIRSHASQGVQEMLERGRQQDRCCD